MRALSRSNDGTIDHVAARHWLARIGPLPSALRWALAASAIAVTLFLLSAWTFATGAVSKTVPSVLGVIASASILCVVTVCFYRQPDKKSAPAVLPADTSYQGGKSRRARRRAANKARAQQRGLPLQTRGNSQ